MDSLEDLMMILEHVAELLEAFYAGFILHV